MYAFQIGAPSDFDLVIPSSGTIRVHSIPPVYLSPLESAHLPVSAGPLRIGPGAIGCFLAHQEAWRLVALSSEVGGSAALVLERDAVLTTYGRRWFGQALAAFKARAMNILNLGYLEPRLKLSLRTATMDQSLAILRSTRQLHRKARPPKFEQMFGNRTHAYFVNAQYAEWLSCQSPDFTMPVDNWLSALGNDPRHRIWRTQVGLFDVDGTPSEIEARGRL